MIQRMIQRLTLIAFIAMLFSSALAIAEEKKEEENGVDLGEIVVTATKTERKKEDVPVSVTVITGEEIRQKGIPVDLSDVLLQEAGIDITRSIPGSIAGINIRGLGYGRSALLIDGQPADLLTYAGRHPLQMIDPNNVERIEIVRGAASALYGANAMGGVVNIITKNGEGTNKNKLTVGYDSLDSPWAGFSTNGTLDRFSYNLNGRYFTTQGYKPIPEPTTYGEKSLQNAEWRDVNLGGKLGFSINENSEISFSPNYLDTEVNDVGRPHTIHNIKESFENLEYKQRVNDLYSFVLDLNYRSHDATFRWDSYSFDWNPTGTDVAWISDENVNKYGGEFKNQFNFPTVLSVQNRAILGVNYWLETMDNQGTDYSTGAGVLNNTAQSKTQNVGIYVQDEAEILRRLFITLGARYDNFKYYDTEFVDYSSSPTIKATGDTSYDTFNPRGGIKYKLTDSTSLRASAGKGFRPPQATDMLRKTSWSEPNPDLKPEKATTYDIGIDQVFGCGHSISVTWYRNKLEDAITWLSLPSGKWQPQNVGEAESKGVEVEFKQQIDPNWSAFVNYTHNESKVTEEPDDPTLKGKKMIYSPQNKAGFGVTYDLPKVFTGSVQGRYFDEQFADAQNSKDFTIPSYFVADCKFTYHLPVNKNLIDITAGVNNIFDEKYTRYRPGWLEEPRVFYAQLGYNF
ncbi:MAG: TonB-dependent receptor [Candidatus Schekmanbacteria bacterium]|nr:TonB-dependent receptor [Candidatus Schekmanbacteria bacterium]